MVKKITLFLILILFFSMAWGYLYIWRSPKFALEINDCEPFAHVLTMDQYSLQSESHERPFVFQYGSVFVFGSEHTKDPTDPQILLIEKHFKKFLPTVVLVEGRLGFHVPFFMDPVEQFGEMGAIAQLAKQAGIQIYSWDIPKSALLEELSKKYTGEQIVLKEILNPYFSNLRFGMPESPEVYVEKYLDRASWLGMQEKISSIEDIDRIWKRDFQDEKDWRETSDQWGLPGYLGKISDDANYVRNQHLMCSIQSLTDQGEKVFIVCGSSHAVCIKPQIRRNF